MPRPGPSIRLRAVLPAALMSILAVFVAYGVILLLVQHDESNFIADDRLRSARDIATAVERERLPARLPVSGSSLIQILGAEGEVLSASPALYGRPALDIPKLPADGLVRAEVCPSQEPELGCLIVIAVATEGPDGRQVVISAAKEPSLLPSVTVTIGLAALTVAVLGIAAWESTVLVGRALRPVEDIRAELAEITATNLERRVPVPPSGDEIGQLARTVNATLDRLEEAVVSNQGFVANASHELRSPLTALRSRTEVALLHPERVDHTEALREILTDVDRLEALVADLLLLARLDAGGHDTRDERSDLAEVVRIEISRGQRRVPITTEHLEPAVVACEELELARIVVNLLDNAARHATSRVTVRLTAHAGGSPTARHATLEVLDDGPGVPPDDRERIFERFVRLDPSRGREVGGTGLGLSIAREVATLHGGDLRVGDSEVGARFVLRMPLAPD